MSEPFEHFKNCRKLTGLLRTELEKMESEGHIIDGEIFLAHSKFEDDIVKLEIAIKEHLGMKF